jgi:hypothetical protein
MSSPTRFAAAHRRSAFAAAFALLGLAAVLAAIQAGSADAAAPLSWSAAIGVPVTAPANAGSEPAALFDWGACPTAELCAGVGSYVDENGNREAMAATRTNGSWGQAVQIALPPGAATSNQTAGFELADATVACNGPGTCTAVGFYVQEDGDKQAMVVSETDGVWGTAQEIEPPANAASNPRAALHWIACVAPDECVAVGSYTNEDGRREAMIAQQQGGSWQPASGIELPANAAAYPESRLWSVACAAVGSCVALGEYSDGTTNREEAMVLTETDGQWGQARQPALPANAAGAAKSFLDAVVCVVSGPCVADGRYTDSAGAEQAMVGEETGGLWSAASEIAAPADAAGNPAIGFGFAPGSIACPAAGACAIVARYTDSAGAEQAMVSEQTSGLWPAASEIAAPANAATNPATTLDPACAAPGSCVAVGAYTDNGGGRQAMIAEQTSGLWGPGSEIAAPLNAATNPGVIFGEVQCPALGSCLAFGQYTSHASATRDLEVVGVAPRENTPPPPPPEEAKVVPPPTQEEAATPAPAHQEAAPPTQQPPAAWGAAAKVAAIGSVSLTGSVIGVQSSGKGSVKLTCTGMAACSGKLTLTVTVKPKQGKQAKARTKAIGSAAFSIPPSKSETVTIALTAAGRALLKAAHGKLRASLTIHFGSGTTRMIRIEHQSVQLLQKR